MEITLYDLHIRSSGWAIGAVVRIERTRLRRGRDDVEIVMNFVREPSGWKILSIEPE